MCQENAKNQIAQKVLCFTSSTWSFSFSGLFHKIIEENWQHWTVLKLEITWEHISLFSVSFSEGFGQEDKIG